MYKDKIEERLNQLEHDVRTLKSDYRQGVDELLTEIHTFQNIIIEDRIDSIRQQIAKQYEILFIDLLLKNAKSNLDECCQEPCIKNRRKECHDFFLTRLRNVVKAPDQDQNGNSQLSDNELVTKYPFLGRSPCMECFQKYLHEKEQLKNTIDRLTSLKQSMTRKNNGTYISELPDDLVISNLIDPLSHELRFAMLKELSTGSMTFKELSKLTDSKGGHLLYHLNKLIESGLVIKIAAEKRYSLTDKGMGIMELIKRLYTNQ